MHVLVVDDDEETLEVVGRALERDGHQVLEARSPAEALSVLRRARVELVVLDVMLERESGLELCARLRSDGCNLPILFLSARGAVNARIEGLDAGGDDYLPKPFALRELVARVRALGRRTPSRRPQRLALGPVTLDFDARTATAAGAEIPITRREWEILRILADAKGRTVPFDEVLEDGWGEATESTRASLDVLVSRLRRKLGTAGEKPIIRTVRGVGYALELLEE